jgi:hypothetical protein
MYWYIPLSYLKHEIHVINFVCKNSLTYLSVNTGAAKVERPNKCVYSTLQLHITNCITHVILATTLAF